MNRLKKNEQGFGIIEIILVLIIVILLGVVGWFVYRNHHKTTNSTVATTTSNTTTTPTKTTTKPKTVDPNAGYLVMEEWGLRFKVPSGLTDVRYVIHGGTAAFYAKPAGSSVQHRSDYDKFDEGGFPQYATGVLYRSTDSTKDKVGTPVQGKKLGDYYYYTAWAFSSMATGAACVGLYGDSESNCQPESTAFQLVNRGDNALLNTIELAQ